jgi:hypothetical protein
MVEGGEEINSTVNAVQGDAQQGGRTFTQADVDRIVSERLARVKEQYKDYDTLKAKVAELEQQKAGGGSTGDTLSRRLGEIERQLGIKDQAIAKLTSELTDSRRVNLVAGVAGRLSAIDPQDANILAATASIDPAGENAEAEVEKVIQALAEKKPYLFKGQGATRLEGFNPGSKSGAAETDQQKVARLYGALGINSYGPLGG